jgi:hypothetical protein
LNATSLILSGLELSSLAATGTPGNFSVYAVSEPGYTIAK